MRDFELLGLGWDGEPLYQSRRAEAYREAFDHIASKSRVYPCFCTRADLNAASAPHQGDVRIYPGTCRNLDDASRLAKRIELEGQGRAPTTRIETPSEVVRFDDVFQGCQAFDLAHDCGDFVLVRSDGGHAYHLATVVDDAEQGVDLVVRGCDLLSSTPQQMFLGGLLGLQAPRYAHVPLLMSPSGRRLAKRDADAGLDEMLAAHGSPEAVLGHIAYTTGLVAEAGPRNAEELLGEVDLETLRGKTEILWCDAKGSSSLPAD